MQIAMAPKHDIQAANRAVVEAVRRLVDEKFAGSQRDAAHSLGVSPATVSAILRGDRGVGHETLHAIADQLGITLDELTGRAAAPKRPRVAASFGRHRDWPAIEIELERRYGWVEPGLRARVLDLFRNASASEMPERLTIDAAAKFFDAFLAILSGELQPVRPR